MTNTRLITKSVVISLAICCVLAVAMLPTVSAAGYGDVRKFVRNPPRGYGQSKLWDVYWDAIDPETGPGRVCSIFTLGANWGENFGINYLTSEDALIIGIAGIFVPEWEGWDHKSAREFYNNWDSQLYFNGEEVEIEITPMRRCHDVDEYGTWIWWEWRIGVTFKKGELEPGLYTFRQTFVEYGEVVWDTDWELAPYYFEIV